jgi:rhodanese-related sulfurtransferase
MGIKDFTERMVSATETTTAAQMVADAKTRVENLSPEQVAAEIAAGPLLLVDLRETEERTQSGAIGGSVHAPRGLLEFYADPNSAYHRDEFEPTRRTILFCASGGRSALAAESLARLGYRNVAHLDGGMKGWVASGRDISR